MSNNRVATIILIAEKESYYFVAFLVSKYGYHLNYGLQSRNNRFYTKTELKEQWDVIETAKINLKSVYNSKMESCYRYFDVTNASFQRNCSFSYYINFGTTTVPALPKLDYILFKQPATCTD